MNIYQRINSYYHLKVNIRTFETWWLLSDIRQFNLLYNTTKIPFKQIEKKHNFLNFGYYGNKFVQFIHIDRQTDGYIYWRLDEHADIRTDSKCIVIKKYIKYLVIQPDIKQFVEYPVNTGFSVYSARPNKYPAQPYW